MIDLVRARRNDFGDEVIVVVDVFATGDDGNAANLSAVFEVEGRDIEFDDDGDVFGETADDDFACGFTERTTLADADGFAGEGEGHADGNFSVGIDAIEVGVENATGDGVTLHAFDHDIAGGIATDEAEDDIGTEVGGENFIEFGGIDGGADGFGITAIANDRNTACGTKFVACAFFARNADITFDLKFFHSKNTPGIEATPKDETHPVSIPTGCA